jgi:serine/threonine protein phosphatase 1
MNFKRTLVVGDTHGSWKGLQAALTLANFQPAVDRLIALGDTMDGWSECAEIIEFYRSLPLGSLIYIRGNHDQAYIEWVDNGCRQHTMHGHGGHVTTYVYTTFHVDLIGPHAEWLRATPLRYIDEQNRLFVHAGWNVDYEFSNPAQATQYEYMWNRSFWQGMFEGRNYAKDFKEVFIGHTPTFRHKGNGAKPMNRRNVWNLDTGGAFKKGCITVMDVDTKQFWQSEKWPAYYPLEMGRG